MAVVAAMATSQEAITAAEEAATGDEEAVAEVEEAVEGGVASRKGRNRGDSNSDNDDDDHEIYRMLKKREESEIGMIKTVAVTNAIMYERHTRAG